MNAGCSKESRIQWDALTLCEVFGELPIEHIEQLQLHT